MGAPSTIPVRIRPEAAALVAELGVQEPFERMLEWIRQNVPGLRSVQVNFGEDYEFGTDHAVIFDVTMDAPHMQDDRPENAWRDWLIHTFPPQVFQHFTLFTYYAATDAR